MNAELEQSGNELEAGLLQKFGELPTGVQRVIIAIVVIAILAAMMLVREMMKTEEDAARDEM